MIVITGASGMLGRALMRELAAEAPVGTAFQRTQGSLVRLNLLDHSATAEFFRGLEPRVIIHTAAERRPDASQADPEGTRALNVESTRLLARLAKELGAWMLYLSTDYVFDGTAPPYKPGDKTNPLNFYGQTKLEGEEALFAETSAAAVLRVGVLFERVEFTDESAVTAVLKDVRSGKPAAIDDWGQRYPTFVDDVAVVCHQLTSRKLSGVFHWGGNERFTKYRQALLMGELLGLSTSHLRPDPNPPAGAPRPHDCQLDCSLLESWGVGQRTAFREALGITLRESPI